MYEVCSSPGRTAVRLLAGVERTTGQFGVMRAAVSAACLLECRSKPLEHVHMPLSLHASQQFYTIMRRPCVTPSGRLPGLWCCGSAAGRTGSAGPPGCRTATATGACRSTECPRGLRRQNITVAAPGRDLNRDTFASPGCIRRAKRAGKWAKRPIFRVWDALGCSEQCFCASLGCLTRTANQIGAASAQDSLLDAVYHIAAQKALSEGL